MQAKKKIALLIALTMLLLPITANAQAGWVARNIYAINQNIGFGMSIDYNETSNVLKVLLVNNDMAEQNIGLAILEVVFGVNSIPSNLDAYLLINGETVKYQNQLINWSIDPVTWTLPDDNTVDAYYAYAYIYLFTNQSIINEVPQRPYFEANLKGQNMPQDQWTDMTALSNVIASSGGRVYVDYSFEGDSGIDWPVIGIVGVGIIILVLVVFVWRRKR